MDDARIAAVALGANLGDRLASLRAATQALAGLGEVVAKSSIYETPPVGPPQPDYLNAVVLLRTRLASGALLDGLLAIERQLGRVRETRWGPRVIDLDLIAVDDEQVSTPPLVLPHPQAHRRAFVLVPLCDVAPQWVLPGRGQAQELLAALPAADRVGLRRIDGVL